MGDSKNKLECRFNLGTLHELFKEKTTNDKTVDVEQKKEIMKDSPFYRLCFPPEKTKRTSNTFLFSCIADLYDTDNKMFCINGVWMSLCVKEVGHLLGLPSAGDRIPKVTVSRSQETPKYFRDRSSQHGLKSKYRNEILKVLRLMKINNEVDKLDYKRFVNLYILVFVVKVSTSSLCSLGDVLLCEKLENLENINWSQEILAVLEEFLQTYKKNVKEQKSIAQIGCMAPLLEAWFCMRINIAEDEDHHEDLPIFKYHGLCSVHKEDDWASLITQVGSDKMQILNCQQDSECYSRENQFKSLGCFRLSMTVHEHLANNMLEDIAADFLKFSLKSVVEKHGISNADSVIQMGREYLGVSEDSWSLFCASAREGCQILMAEKGSQSLTSSNAANTSNSMDEKLEGQTDEGSNLVSPQQTMDLHSEDENLENRHGLHDEGPNAANTSHSMDENLEILKCGRDEPLRDGTMKQKRAVREKHLDQRNILDSAVKRPKKVNPEYAQNKKMLTYVRRNK